MTVKVEIKMDVESMTDYMIYHIYKSKAGVITIILGVFNAILAVASAMKKDFPYMVLFLPSPLLFLVYFLCLSGEG